MDKAEFLKKVERMANPNLVRVRDDKIEEVEIGDLPDIGLAEPAPPQMRTEEEIIRYALLVNSINHQFWDVSGGEFERYANNGKVGALAMMDGLSRWVESAGSLGAMEADLPVSEDQVKKFFGPIPDPAGRAAALTEALGPQGKAAAQRMAESLAKGATWGVAVAAEISAFLPIGFEDPFLKKSQLCLWMAKGMLEVRGFGPIDTDLTCFADYQIPKVLRGLGILEYEAGLAKKVDDGSLLESCGEEERAIRAATIVACERIAQEKKVSPAQLDFWLWTKRNETPALFHRTKTRRY